MSIDPCNWMTNIYGSIKNTPFSSISLFGSHDSGMSTLKEIDGSVLGSGGITQAQTLSIYDQIVSAGVRYLDIRPVFWENEISGENGYYTAHYTTVKVIGYVGWLGLSLDEVVQQLVEAAKNIGDNDILLIELSHGYQLIDQNPQGSPGSGPLTSDQLSDIAQVFTDSTGELYPYLYQDTNATSPVNFWNLTPGDFAAAGKKIFVFTGSDTATSTNGGPVFPKVGGTDYHNSWSNCQTDDYTQMDGLLAADLKTNPPTSPYLLAYHCTGEPLGPSLEDMANSLNPLFQDALAGWCSQGLITPAKQVVPVIVTADWVSEDTAPLLAPCVAMNLGQYNGLLTPTALAQSSISAPAIAEFNNVLYYAWRGTDEHLNLAWSLDGGVTFASGAVYTSSQRSKYGPSLCVQGSNLYIAWTGTSPHLNFAALEFDGAAVTGFSPTTWGDESSASGLGLASLNGNLYVAWSGTGDGNLYVAYAPGGGIAFSKPAGPVDARSRQQPALAVLDGTLYLAWGGANTEDVYLAQVVLGDDGAPTGITDVNVCDSSVSAVGQSLAAVNGTLYLGWVDSTSFALKMAACQGTVLSGPIYTSNQECQTDDFSAGNGMSLGVSGQNLYFGWPAQGGPPSTFYAKQLIGAIFQLSGN